MFAIPWWAMLLIQILNMVVSNGAVAAMTYASTGDEHAALIAGGGSLINHLRQNPLGIPELKAAMNPATTS